MYRCIGSKKYSLAVNRFPVTAKKVSDVYRTGVRIWDSDDSKNYSVVIGVFRIILSKNKSICEIET